MQRNDIDVRLLIGDWLVLLLFVFIGQRDHEMALVGPLPTRLQTTLAVGQPGPAPTLALGLPWTAAAWALGALRPPAGAGWRPWLGRVAAAWLIAAPLGLLVRALVRGQAAIPVPFMLVILGLGLLFILGWRGIYYWLRMRRKKHG